MRSTAYALAGAMTMALSSLLLPPWTQAQESGSVDTSQFVNRFPLPEATWQPMRSVYGVADTAFWYGGVLATKPPSGSYDQIWTTMRDMGIRILERRSPLQNSSSDPNILARWDALISACNPDSAERVIVNGSEVAAVGWAREVILHAVDSAPSYYWPSQFLERSYGSTTTNGSVLDHLNHPVRERIYDTTNTTRGATILQRIAFGYDSTFHLRRFPNRSFDENIENASAFFTRTDLPFSDHPIVTLWLAVTAHLFEGEPANNSDTLLLVDIYNEIPLGTTYVHDGSVLDTAEEDMEVLFATVAFLKRELIPNGDPLDWNKYCQSSKPVDMVVNGQGLGGPFNPGNSAHRMDLRVRWTGREKLALRSIALRDSLAHLLFGQDDADSRAKIFGMTDRIMRGPTWQAGQDTLLTQDTLLARRQRVMRFYTGDEGFYSTAAPFNWLDSILYRRYGGGTTRSTYGVRAFRAQAYANPHTTLMTSQNENSVELYVLDPRTVDSTISTRFGLADYLDAVPSLPEHNGGRFHIPQIDLSGTNARQAVDDYARAFNRLTLRHYAHGESIWPWLGGLRDLGMPAWTSRRTGRRLILWPGVHTGLVARWSNVNGLWAIRDTLLAHIVEPAELRCLINIGLCYGAHGVHYSWIGSDTNEFGHNKRTLGRDPTTERDTILYDYVSDYGALPLNMPSSLSIDDASDRADPFVLCNTQSDHFPLHRVEIPDFWTGFRPRSREIRRLNREWIPRVWPHLKRLRWRDGYSMHFTAHATWMDASTDDLDSTLVKSRPLDPGEIISSIRARDRNGRLDSLEETYVELGLFDALHGATALRDTHHLMLVNRRTFERPGEVLDTSARGRLMDSLAEWRRVLVKLNLPRVDTTHYLFARVRELGHDTANVPGSSGARAALDTTVAIDSTFAVWVRPGGASLFEVTYRVPEEDLWGILAYSNGKKILFDGRRFHATYARFQPNTNDTTSFDDRIYYACSYPVSGVEDQIRWNPMDVDLSFDGLAGDSVRCQNRTPSLTVDFTNGDTAAVIVWTCHPLDSTYTGMREVVTRRVRMWDPDGMGANKELGPLTTVGYHNGSHVNFYGTPTISRMDGGTMVAWSDSTLGIRARFQKRPSSSTWWMSQPQMSTAGTIGLPSPGGMNPGALFPSMPPFVHVASRDSSVALVWQQRHPTNATFSDIGYIRLEHFTQNGTPCIRSYPMMKLNPVAGTWAHPSIDQWQCWWYQAYEGVAWEDDGPRRHALV